MTNKNNNESIPLPTPELIRVTYELLRQHKPSLHLRLRNVYMKMMGAKTFLEIERCLRDVQFLVNDIVQHLQGFQSKSIYGDEDTPDGVNLDGVTSDRVTPDRVTPDRVTSDRVTPDGDWVKDVLINVVISKWQSVKSIDELDMPTSGPQRNWYKKAITL